jgi:diguanylate cyclase (GGDEF)-like protein
MNGAIRSYRVEMRHLNAGGDIVWANVSVSLVRDASQQPLHFIVQVEDISSRKLMEERLRRLADFDSLTGVRNRRQFERDLFLQVGNCQRYGEQAALLMIDLDDFKRINDTYGHRVGDAVLKQVASAIRRRLRSTDIVARLGGDEFAVLLPDTPLAGATALAENLRAALHEEQNRQLLRFVTASFGTAERRAGADGDDFVREADDALYSAKRSGRDSIVAAPAGSYQAPARS